MAMMEDTCMAQKMLDGTVPIAKKKVIRCVECQHPIHHNYADQWSHVRENVGGFKLKFYHHPVVPPLDKP